MNQRNTISMQTAPTGLMGFYKLYPSLHSRNNAARNPVLFDASILLCRFVKLMGTLCILAFSQQSLAQEYDYSLPTGPQYLPGEDRPQISGSRKAYNTSSPVFTMNPSLLGGQDTTPSLFESSEDGLQKFLDNPLTVIKNAGLGALSAGLDAAGALGALEDSIEFVKQKTRYDFGDCSRASITQQFQLQSCLTDEAALSLQSDYQLDTMELKLRWSF